MTDIRSILQQAGFTGSALDTAQAIVMAESGGNAHAYNGNAATGDNSYGLFQINMLGGMGAQRRKQFELASNDALFNPLTNAEIAYHLSNGGRDFSPWSTYKSGAYRKYMGSASPILDSVLAPQGAASSPPTFQQGNASLESNLQNIATDLSTGTHTAGQEVTDRSLLLPLETQDFGSWIASLRARTGPLTLEQISKPLNLPSAQNSGDSGPWTDGSLMPSITGTSNGFDPNTGGMSTTGSPASGQAASLIDWAKQFVGTPYVWGGNSLTQGVDCSGLVQQVFRHFGINLPRLAADQANSGTRVSLDQLQPGDLVAWDDNPYQRGADHIAIALGNGQILEAPRPGLSVRVRQLGTWSADSKAWGVQILH